MYVKGIKMKTFPWALVIVVFVLIGSFFYSSNWVSKKQHEQKNQLDTLVTIALEKAYFDGQKEAITGDVRICLNKDSVYEWVKSPWNNGKHPYWTPTKHSTYFTE